MKEIGNNFKTVRESSGLDLQEVSNDTGINIESLKQIEEGNIGIFKDIFELKGYLVIYAKYLGLDTNEVVDEFNQYMFEYTSKIPAGELEKAIENKKQEEIKYTLENKDIKAISPYSKEREENNTIKITIGVIIGIVLISVIIVIAIKIFMFD